MSHVPSAIAVHRVAQPLSLLHLLREQAERIPDALAILAPERIPLTYGRLYRHIDDAVRTLHAAGVGRHDRVALVLPNGPELAVATLAVMSGAACAPLNPAYGADEFDAHLADLHAKALIVQAGMDSPVRAVARSRGLHVIELAPIRTAEAGIFALTGAVQRRADPQSGPLPSDVALVLSTSGTTSRPKLVPLTHTNVCASAHNMYIAFELVESDRCLNVLPLFHTYGFMGPILGSLMAGASVVCTPSFSVPAFFAWMEEFHPTWYPGTPTVHQAILAHADQHSETIARCPLRLIRSSTAFLPSHVRAALERVFRALVVESYGMTETSIIVCNPPLQHPYKPGSVGMTVGPEVAIMDEDGTVLPAEAIGEIVVRGASVMSGYDNDPAANTRAFTHGWFRTGDQGFLDAEGYLFVTGRLTERINRGGEKIAPWEVDAVLMEHPAVAQAVTFAVPHPRLGEDIAAAVVLRHNAMATASDIRQFAAMRLADFKVPRQVLLVKELPKGASGKQQRRSLAGHFGLTALAQGRAESATNSRIPRTPIEELLIGIWTQVCEVEGVSIHDDFFLLGGDSLVATQLLSRVREAVHVEIPFSRFFAMPTVAGMAEYIETTRRTASSLQAPPLRPVPRDRAISLSYPQRRLWFLEQLKFSRHAYHLLEVLRLRGPLQAAALEQSLQEMTWRHEVFRTTFVNTGEQPLQVIGPKTTFPLPVIDLRGLPESKREVQVRTLAQTEVRRPFDLAQGPLIRATLVRLSHVEHVLLLAMHHIVSDGWSHDVFWRELGVLYESFTAGKPSPLPALSIQYMDFTHWQQQWLQGEILDTQLGYWKRQLAGVSMLQLPTDHPRPAVQTFRGARHSLTLSPRLTRALKTLSQQQGVTLFMTLLATFQTLLYRYTRQDDIAVGTLIANRNRVEIEGLIGFFVNTLVLRTEVSGDLTFRELLDRVRGVALGAYEHQDVPYEKLLEALRPPRDLSRNPLFQVMCVLHNTPQQAPALPGLTVEPLEIDPGTARFDVSLEFRDTPEGLRGRFEYSTDLFEAATIARMAGHLRTLLEGIVADPEQHLSQLPLLTADERHRLLVEWNSTAAPYPDDQCLHHLFETQVTRTPDAVAVVCGDESLTYRQLNRRANQVAHYLQALGVGTETLVGLCVERSLVMVVALLGILKAGAAYVPLDPAYPSERLAFMIEDAQPPVVLTQGRLLPGLPSHGAQMVCLDTHWPSIAQCSNDDPISGATADNAAYLLYTSGSSGMPKGVLGVHRASLNVLAWMWQTFPYAQHEVCCQKTSMSFVDSIQELLGPLLQGVRTVLVADEVLKDLHRFVQTLALHRVTRLILVPSLLRTLLDTHPDLQVSLPGLKLWFAGGEALSSDLVLRFRRCLPHSQLINLYGMSEASADTTWHDTNLLASELSCVPIGRPIANTHAYVLDHHLQPVPIGVTGELCVGGVGLARGYFNRPQLTAERFIPHPFSHEPGARLFKTGDLARYGANGYLEYLGRLDHQTKLRGIRIELGEIETALAQHPSVREAVVTVREDIPGEPRMTAYVVPAHAPGPSLGQLRHFLAEKLPAAMIPATFIIIEALPLTPSGKINRQALPMPGPIEPILEEHYVAPRNPIEEQVASLWCDLLGLSQVGVEDNFFELGGHSLLAMQLLSRVHDATHVEVSLANFFETPTIAGIAAIIETADQTEQDQTVHVIMPMPREGPLPAAIAQELFWLFEQILPGLPLFNIPCVIRLQGSLNVEILEQSFKEIIRRHEVLRTTFAIIDGRLLQIIAPTVHMPLQVRDLRTVPEAEREGEAHRLMQEESHHPFDLSHGSLLRACILRLGEEDYILLVTLHHIISDGWSVSVLVQELAALYHTLAAGAPSRLPELPIQYADFALWQRQKRHAPKMEAQLVYWKERLHDPLPMLELPAARPRGTALSLRSARIPLALPEVLVEELKGLSREEGCTLFMTCLAAFKMLLYGYTGQEDLRVATLVANRARRETEGLIGLLANTVILRTDLGGNPTCREVLQRVRATTLAAYTHQDLPFEELARTLEGERNLHRTALCQVMIIWQDFPLPPPQDFAQTLRFQAMESSIVAPNMALTTFDIILILRERFQGVTGTCIYKTDLFDATTIHQMLDDFQGVLVGFNSQLGQAVATLRSLFSRKPHD
jgi:amino acid adenylation domain-containing protein